MSHVAREYVDVVGDYVEGTFRLEGEGAKGRLVVSLYGAVVGDYGAVEGDYGGLSGGAGWRMRGGRRARRRLNSSGNARR